MSTATAGSTAEPRFLTAAAVGSVGGAAGLAETAAVLGRPLRPWAEAFGAVASERAEGRWRYPLAVLSVPRQAGKTTLVGVVAVDRCLRQAGARVWYTAQSRLDAMLRFLELANLLHASRLRGWPMGRRSVPVGAWDYRVTVGQGAEVISFPNGSEIRIFPPRADSLHGSVTDLVVIDEARFFPAELGNKLLAAALPTQVTRDGQVWIVSTAGGPESTFLAEQVERGRAAAGRPGGRVCFGEWSIGDDVAAGDLLAAVWGSHPAAGLVGGPAYAAVELAAQTMPAWQFAQEYGNRWLTEGVDRLLPGGWWAAAASTVGPVGPLVFGFDVSPDRGQAAVVACGDGIVEVVRAERGARWLAPEVVRLVDRWDPVAVVGDPAGPAVTAVEALRPLLGDRLVTVRARELVAACGAFYDGLEGGGLRQFPHPALDHAVAGASQRAISGSWVFDRADGGHVLVAAALAFWAYARPPEPGAEDPAVY